MIIYLALPLPTASSDPPESSPGRFKRFLFGLASDGVYMCPARYRAGGSLLHCLSTLTKSMQDACFGNLLCKFPPGAKSARGGLFLLHWPWSRLHRTLSGILPCEARTFLIRLPSAKADDDGCDHLSYLIPFFLHYIGSRGKVNQNMAPRYTGKLLPPINSRQMELRGTFSLSIPRKYSRNLRSLFASWYSGSSCPIPNRRGSAYCFKTESS